MEMRRGLAAHGRIWENREKLSTVIMGNEWRFSICKTTTICMTTSVFCEWTLSIVFPCHQLDNMDISHMLPYYAAYYDEIIWTKVHIVHYNPVVQLVLDLRKKTLLLGVFLFCHSVMTRGRPTRKNLSEAPRDAPEDRQHASPRGRTRAGRRVIPIPAVGGNLQLRPLRRSAHRDGNDRQLPGPNV